MIIDVDFRSSNETEKVLSNLFPVHFIFLDKQCKSVEGVLQALKFTDHYRQNEIIQLSGFPAKMAGKNVQYESLHWFGMSFDRHSSFYQEFLEELFYCSFEHNSLRRVALMSTQGHVLRHTIGCNDSNKTILTETEFLTFLNKVKYDLLYEYNKKPEWLT